MTKKFKTGDLVEVRAPAEILATLDETGCLDGLPFMPEMLAFCGGRFRVSGRAHKTCDTVNQTGGRWLKDAVHLHNLRCDGSGHGDCKATCLLFWKVAWLKAAADSRAPEGTPERRGPHDEAEILTTRLRANAAHSRGAEPVVYRCQATALYDATTPLEWWDPRQYLEDLTSGNTSLGHMLRVWFFHGLHKLMGLGVGYRLWLKIYDALQPHIGGYRYPYRAGTIPLGAATPVERLDLQPGERVRVRPHETILATLNRAKQNRGMRFDPEMVPYCGKTYTVLKRVDKIIDEKTGEMLEMGTPSVVLDGVVCRSEFSPCRLFCPRALPSYWREIWLERVTDSSSPGQPSRVSG